jgi:hypothetical protein
MAVPRNEGGTEADNSNNLHLLALYSGAYRFVVSELPYFSLNTLGFDL